MEERQAMKLFLLMVTTNAMIASLYFIMLIIQTFKRMHTHIKGRFSPG